MSSAKNPKPHGIPARALQVTWSRLVAPPKSYEDPRFSIPEGQLKAGELIVTEETGVVLRPTTTNAFIRRAAAPVQGEGKAGTKGVMAQRSLRS